MAFVAAFADVHLDGNLAEERNAENLLIIKDKGLARLYMENWERHQDHSEAY